MRLHQFEAGPLPLVGSAHDALARYLAGSAEWLPTLSYVKRTCEQLRIDACDETSGGLVELVVTLTARLDAKSSYANGDDGTDPLIIALKVALQDLEAHFWQLSLMD